MHCYNSGAGGNVSAGPYVHQKEALAVAKECLLAAVKADPKAASVWVNLANAYYMAGEHRNSKRCLEQVTTVAISFFHTLALSSRHKLSQNCIDLFLSTTGEISLVRTQ